MGIIKVNIVGNARDGERVYASTRYPGKALVESHSSHVDDDILLGITMESSRREASTKGKPCTLFYFIFVRYKCKAFIPKNAGARITD